MMNDALSLLNSVASRVVTVRAVYVHNCERRVCLARFCFNATTKEELRKNHGKIRCSILLCCVRREQFEPKCKCNQLTRSINHSNIVNASVKTCFT